MSDLRIETGPFPTAPASGKGEFGERVWAAALALVGVRFRLHGRDPAHGLDCVGLVAASYAAAGHCVDAVPDDYRLRDVSLPQIDGWLCAAGLRAVASHALGDVVVSDMGRGQMHLMIAGACASVHAHAGLRRVVLMPGAVGLVVGRWRVSRRE